MSKFVKGDIIKFNDSGLETVYGSSVGLAFHKNMEMEVTSISEPMTETGDCIITVNNLEVNQFLLLDEGFDLVRRGKTITMISTTGNVIDKSADGKRIKLDTDGEWYGAFAASSLSHVMPGMAVNFKWDYSKNVSATTGQPYRNIKGAVLLMGAPVAPVGAAKGPIPIHPISSVSSPSHAAMSKVGEPILTNSRCIIRQNSLTNAVNYVENTNRWAEHPTTFSPQDVIEIAKIFEAYSSGDDDEKEVEKELLVS